MSFFKGKLMAGARFLLITCVAVAGLFSIIATGGGDSTTSLTADTGTLSIGLTDASTNEYQAVYVTIKEVQIHHADGDWETIGYPGDEEVGETYNLLELRNGVIEQLVSREMDPGDYTQMRLLLGDQGDDSTNFLGNFHSYANYLIDSNDDEEELKIPSGFQSGIKLVHPFNISAGGITELVLDVIVPKSIVKTGSGNGKYIFKPTIKVIGTKVSFATVSGTVTETVEGSPVAMEGVTVTAQYYDGGVPAIQASATTDENGSYKMILPENTPYNIVAYYDGYEPSCIADVLLAAGDNLTEQDFTLTQTAIGTVSGDITIAGGDENDSAFLSFTQDCNGTIVEVKSSIPLGFDSSGSLSYTVTLTEGKKYSGMATVKIDDTEENTQLPSGGSTTFDVTDGGITMLDSITFP